MMQLRTPGNAPQQPPIADLDVYDLIAVTAQLKAILERETEHLKLMEVKELAKLQEEKLKLTKLMEGYKSILSKRPELIRALDPASREELVELTDGFNEALAENLRRTAVARAVNQRIVQAIMEVVTENTHAGTYNKYGASAVPSDMAVSFNLNERA